MTAGTAPPPCILHEDEHVLAVCKPAGWNTHSPSAYAGEGIYEWLRHREARWSGLAVVHRLDKDTSGILLFAKTALASKSLTGQFSRREVRKGYVLVTDRPVPEGELRVESDIVRVGERYASRPVNGAAGKAGKALAVTVFTSAGGQSGPGLATVQARPVTGRTHQIRVQAAARGFPVLGDQLYGGTPAPRLFLHAQDLAWRDPATGREMQLACPANFAADVAAALRGACIVPQETSAYRVLHGAADGWPGWRVDRLGDYLLAQSEAELSTEQARSLQALVESGGLYYKQLSRQVRQLDAAEASPRHVSGAAAPERFTVMENGLQFELGFAGGYSVGLFLDQRDNRRRFLTGHVAAGFSLYPEAASGTRPEVLNTFAYTCAFSLCAARAGARVTSLDLSRKYLDWGRRNFQLNGMDPAQHDFIYGDAFDWLGRMARKNRQFDALVLDPPTFSQSKERARFRLESDYARLVSAALPVLRPGGVLLACANTARLEPGNFLEMVRDAIRDARRGIAQEHYVPQPPDFPVSPGEPAYLKTVWMRVG